MYLMIVRRGCEDTFHVLQQTFGDRRQVKVIWDRRMGERRTQSGGTPNNEERRRKDRRVAPSPNWRTRDFIVARVADEPAQPADT